MKIKDRINEYLKEQNYTDEEIAFLDSSSVYVAEQIATYAHRNQKRINGDYYFLHPHNVLTLYRNFVGIIENDPFCIDVDFLIECGIPYSGVQEVCLLHDVLEDTEVSIDEIEEVFRDLSLEDYFNTYIKAPLLLVTHDKNEDYATYVGKLLCNPVASIVKFMDMADNSNFTGLTELGEYEIERLHKYAFFSKVINDKWHFLENVNKYKKDR